MTYFLRTFGPDDTPGAVYRVDDTAMTAQRYDPVADEWTDDDDIFRMVADGADDVDMIDAAAAKTARAAIRARVAG